MPNHKHTWSRRDREVLFVLKRFFKFEHTDAGWKALADVFNAFLCLTNHIGYKAIKFQWTQIVQEGAHPFNDLKKTSFYSRDTKDPYVKIKTEIFTWMQLDVNKHLLHHKRISEDPVALEFIERTRATQHAKDLQRRQQKRTKIKREKTIAMASEYQLLEEPMIIDDDIQIIADIQRKQQVSVTVHVEKEIFNTAQTDDDGIIPGPTIDVHTAVSVSMRQPTFRRTTTAPKPGVLDILLPVDKFKPRLLFRFSDQNSQGSNTFAFKAGAYRHTPDPLVPKAPDFLDDPEVQKRFLKRHLDKEETATPYISLTNSLIWALHKAARSQSLQTSKIAVIDASKVKAYHVFDHVRELNLAHKRYRGVMEWVVWGIIPEEAVINCFTLDSLLELTNEDKTLGQILRLDSTDFAGRCMSTWGRRLKDMPLDNISAADIGKAIMNFSTCILGQASMIAWSETLGDTSLHSEMAYYIADNWRISKRCRGKIRFIKPQPPLVQSGAADSSEQHSEIDGQEGSVEEMDID